MVKRMHVLLLGLGDRHDALAGRLLLLNFRPLRAETVDAAIALLPRVGEPVRAGIVPVDHACADLPAELTRLRRACGDISFVVVGARPDPATAEAFRKADVRLCLWDRIEDSALRFVVNLALFDEQRGEVRGELRVPTPMVARVFSAAGEKPALVYNLSRGGAYLETHRPTGVGGHVKVELPLPSGKLTLPACVVSTNVPGNLQRPNLPLGMGVEFVTLPADAEAAVAHYVEERSGAFEL
jgi:hypothetical protein